MKWIRWVVVGLVILVVAGLVVREYRDSQVVSHPKYRFNLALVGAEQGLTFVSYDPAEQALLAIPFPSNLAIKSRTSGEYSVSSLYKLGSYTGKGGMFARQKVQGFMRVPVPGYIVYSGNAKTVKGILRSSLLKVIFARSETSLSRLDAIYLLYRTNRYAWREVGESELVRAGVIDNNTYYPERLQEYVGSRLFDWGIGEQGLTVSIINASGENGLGSDMADFLSNLGLDVVMVRSVDGSEILQTSSWQVGQEEDAQEIGYIFENLFAFPEPKIEKVGEEYRANVLVKVGKDAKELF